MKLQVKTDQTETDKLIMTLYGRFHRVRSNVLKLISELGLRAREPLAAQQIAEVMENEMKKLDRLSKQIANVEDVDSRLAAQIRKLSQLMLQDAKFALITHRGTCSDSSSSSRNSPSAPSTPIRTMTPPPPKPPVQSSPLSNKTSQLIKPAFKIRPTSYQLPDEDSLIRKSDANSNRLSHTSPSKPSSTCSSRPGNPFGDFEDDESTPGNPFGDDDSGDDQVEPESEKNVQIKFMRKEIKKLTSRGDHEKAEMVRQVLNEMLNST